MNECRCGQPTRDNAYVCDDCLDRLSKALGDIPWLTEELETTITRQKGVDYRKVGGSSGGKKASERPSPVVWGASEARTHLNALLVSWALYAVAEGIRNSDPRGDQLPGDHDNPATLVDLSRWLMWRVDGLGLNEIGADAVDEVTDAVAKCHRLIDRPADRQYLGTCDLCSDGRLYARPGGKWARCEACDAATDADTVRGKLLKELDDRLCTAAEIARLSTYLGLKADRDSVRKRINQWVSRGVLTEAASFSDEPTFRFGTVYDKLLGEEYAATKKPA